MQNTIIMAFRKRMKSCGYTDIHIKMQRPFDGKYIVKAVEPLASVPVSVVLTRIDMHSMFRF